MSYLTDHVNGDIIDASHLNRIKDMIDDGDVKVNTSSLDIQGNEVISTTRYIKPVRIVAPDSNGIQIYASDGVTQIAVIDENGNLFLKGSVGSL